MGCSAQRIRPADGISNAQCCVRLAQSSRSTLRRLTYERDFMYASNAAL